MIKTTHYKNVKGKYISIPAIVIDYRQYVVILDSDGESDYIYYWRNGKLVYYTEHRYY